MISDTVKVERIKDRRATRELAWQATGSALGGMRDIAVTAMASPFIQLIAANVLVELLQRVKVGTGVYHWTREPDPLNPGMGTHVWKQEKTPILSQELATAIQAVINSAAVIGALGQSGQGIAALIGGKR